MDPVILISTNRIGGPVVVLGYYESEQKAVEAIKSGEIPGKFYHVVTPVVNVYFDPKKVKP